jgi:LysM repeat protein
VHIVRDGDNLIALGARYEIPWQEIAAANGLPENAILRLDQELVIPAKR